MERVKITRTITYTAFVPLNLYPGMSSREIEKFEQDMELANAVEILEFVAAEQDENVSTQVHMTTQVERVDVDH